MKLIIFALLICTLATAHGQMTFGGLLSPSFNPDFFKTVVLQSEAQKLLASPDLPEDLRQRTTDILDATEKDMNNCTTLAMYWMQKRCGMMQLKKAKDAFKVIDDEAKTRATAASSSGIATA